MRITDHRYAAEKSRLELAVRMIRLEARTCTIRRCTGLSEDRIRKLFKTYFPPDRHPGLRRRRGKPPRQTSFFFKSPRIQFEAATLCALFTAFGLIRVSRQEIIVLKRKESLTGGYVFCRAYETYMQLHEPNRISFEHAWNLLAALIAGPEVRLRTCARCTAVYPHDALSLAGLLCPGCRLSEASNDAATGASCISRSRRPACRL